MIKLDDATFEIIAAKYYRNRHCQTIEEFKDDVKLFKRVKRHFKRYHLKEEIQERLVLNDIVIIFNIFELNGAVSLLRAAVGKPLEPYLKPFLHYLNFIKESDMNEVISNSALLEKLRKL